MSATTYQILFLVVLLHVSVDFRLHFLGVQESGFIRIDPFFSKHKQQQI